MDWSIILQNIGFFAVGSGIFAYLIKQLFTISINRDLEKFKADLQLLNIEHQIKYAKLHADRAEILKTIYQKIVELEPTVNQIVHIRKIFPSTKDRVQLLQHLEKEFHFLSDRFKQLSDYFILNRIFFNEGLCKLIDDLLEKIGNVYHVINIIPPIPDDPLYKKHNIKLEDFFASENKEIMDFLKMNKEEIPRLKKVLEEQFRELMGVSKVQG